MYSLRHGLKRLHHLTVLFTEVDSKIERRDALEIHFLTDPCSEIAAATLEEVECRFLLCFGEYAHVDGCLREIG